MTDYGKCLKNIEPYAQLVNISSISMATCNNINFVYLKIKITLSSYYIFVVVVVVVFLIISPQEKFYVIMNF